MQKDIKFYKPKFLFISKKIQKTLSIQKKKKKRKHLSEPDKISPKKYSFSSSNNKNSKNQKTIQTIIQKKDKKPLQICHSLLFPSLLEKRKEKRNDPTGSNFKNSPYEIHVCII